MKHLDKIEEVLTYGLVSCKNLGGKKALDNCRKHGFELTLRDTDKPLLVAHIDNVWGSPTWKAEVEYKNGLFGSKKPNMGIAADDRAGLYALDVLAAEGYSTLLTDGNERGLIGAYKAAENKETLACIKKHPFLIEVDRRGIRDLAYYDLTGLKLACLLASFLNSCEQWRGEEEEGGGWLPKSGSVTDISVLSRISKVPAVNISAAYWFEHRPLEHLIPKFLLETIDAIKYIGAMDCWNTRELLKDMKQDENGFFLPNLPENSENLTV